jgi:RNA polymerase sigma factor (sigma-70 family)
LTDGDMLKAFAHEGDEAAFEAVVCRHAPMVLRVCQGILGDPHEAQDAAQAVFLVLARKASRLKGDASVAPWLHRVAHDLAVDTLRRRQSRRLREEESAKMMTPSPDEQESLTEERIQLLHRQIGALPERYRTPVVMCCLEGQPAEEVARALGLEPATLRKRLERGRDRLRSRLVRLGWPVSAGALIALLSAETGAAVLPATFVSSTVKAAGLAAAGKLAAGVTAGTVSANVAALTKGAVQMILVAKMKMVAAAVVACALTAGTVAVVAQQAAPPAQTHTWVTKTEGGQVDVNPIWGTFDRLDKTGELVIMVQPVAGQDPNALPAPVEVRLKIADGREDIVRKATAALAKGAKVKVGCVQDSATRERFVWELAVM